MTNIYYHPEKVGATIIAEAEAGGAYDFDTLVAFKVGNRIGLAADDGCSCPTPFDGFDLGDLDYPDTWQEFVAYVNAWCDGSSYRKDVRRQAADELIQVVGRDTTINLPPEAS